MLCSALFLFLVGNPLCLFHGEKLNVEGFVSCKAVQINKYRNNQQQKEEEKKTRSGGQLFLHPYYIYTHTRAQKAKRTRRRVRP
jgi:hypothetical protein